jgi:hypothetical protein
MKPYRVTLKYIINDHTHVLSTVIPAYNSERAIDRAKKSAPGEVIEAEAKEITSHN